MLRGALGLFVGVSLVAILGSCKRTEEDAAVAAQPDRRTRCNVIGDQLTQMGMALAQGLTVGLSNGKASIDPAEEAKLRDELEASRVELVAQCMEWPDEALDCFGLSAITQSAKCERILAAAMGEPVLPPDVPAGPTPAWTFDVAHPISDVVGRGDGSVVVLLEPQAEAAQDEAAFVVAVKDGKQVWSRALPKVPFAIEMLDGGQVLAIADEDVYGIGGADGALLWTGKPPTIEDGPAELVAIAPSTFATLLDASGALLRVDPDKCSTGKACVETALRLELPSSYGTRWLEAGIAGGWLVVAPDDGAVWVMDAEGKVALHLVARTDVSWARAHGDLLRVAMDGAVAVVDPKRCGDPGKPIAPITWPPSKKAKWLAMATEREIDPQPTPEGCVVWQADLIVEGDSNAVDIAGDDTWVQSGGFLFAFDASGTQKVRTAVSAESLVVQSGDGLAVVGDLGTESVQLVLTWVSTSGKHERRSALPFADDMMFLTGDVALTPAGPMIVAGLDRKLAAFTP